MGYGLTLNWVFTRLWTLSTCKMQACWQSRTKGEGGTYKLGKIQWQHVKDLGGGQKIQQLTSWKGFHGCKSAKQRRPTGGQQLTLCKGFHGCGTSANKMADNDSQSGREFMNPCQPIKRRPGEAQQLTAWKGFHGGRSANQTEARRHTATHTLEGGKSANRTEAWRRTATHRLEGISWGQVS